MRITRDDAPAAARRRAATRALLPPAPAPGPAAPDAARSPLRRRRDALAEQVTELHWDLGGLAYEMAIRDHFRLDVLVRRAAMLQERDAELAEVERLLRMEERGGRGHLPELLGAPQPRRGLLLAVRHDADAAPAERRRSAPPIADGCDGRAAAPPGPATARSSRVASAQRRCAAMRLAARRRPALLPDLRRSRRRAQPALDALLAQRRHGDAPAAASAEPAPAAAAAVRRASPRLPGPPVSAVLVAVFVGFGALLGDAGRRRPRAAGAAGAARPPSTTREHRSPVLAVVELGRRQRKRRTARSRTGRNAALRPHGARRLRNSPARPAAAEAGRAPPPATARRNPPPPRPSGS